MSTGAAKGRFDADVNIAVVSGESLELNCYTDSLAELRWDFKSVTESTLVTIYNGNHAFSNRSEIVFDASNKTSRLVISDIRRTDAEEYRCSHPFKSTDYRNTNVTVLGEVESELQTNLPVPKSTYSSVVLSSYPSSTSESEGPTSLLMKVAALATLMTTRFALIIIILYRSTANGIYPWTYKMPRITPNTSATSATLQSGHHSVGMQNSFKGSVDETMCRASYRQSSSRQSTMTSQDAVIAAAGPAATNVYIECLGDAKFSE